MKTICIELPDKLADALTGILSQGYFKSEDEAVRFALMKFIEDWKPALIERFQLEDIAWAIQQKGS
ncbi:MAG: hypothetical protein ABFD83_07280 [Armatimonadota bacterium]